MSLEKQSPDQDYDRANGKKLRPPLFDTRMTVDEPSDEHAGPAEEPADKSENRMTKNSQS